MPTEGQYHRKDYIVIKYYSEIEIHWSFRFGYGLSFCGKIKIYVKPVGGGV